MYPRTLLVLLSLILLFSATAPVQSKKTIATCSADSIAAWMKRYHVPTLGLSVIENGKVKSMHVYGGVPPITTAPVNTLWNVASLTKPVTALVTLKLVNEGRWSLDESTTNYYVDPDIKDHPWSKKLSTRILLSHQSGFLNWKRMEPDKKQRFHFEPGTRWGYSGKGYEYLRMALEAKFGKTLQQLAKEELFDKVQMSDTHFGWDDQVDSTRFAWGFTEDMKKINFKYQENNAADWLVTSLNDYSAFAIHVMNGAGLSTSLYKEMTSIQAHFDTLASSRQNGMGLGWGVVRDLPDHEFVLTHDGSDDGVATIVLLLPASKRGVIIFTNGDKGAEVYSLILKALLPDLKKELAKSMSEFK